MRFEHADAQLIDRSAVTDVLAGVGSVQDPCSVDRASCGGEPKLYLTLGTVAQKVNILRLEN